MRRLRLDHPCARRSRSRRVGALPALAADEAAGVEVVEAGTALFPDRSYILTLTEPRESALTTEDVTVDEDGKPVENLSVLSSASSEGLGTVLLIDSSNSMKGSIDAAMEAARAFPAGIPASRSPSCSSTRSRRRAATHDGACGHQRGAREAAEARRGNAHLRRARRGGRTGAWIGARGGPDRAALRRRRRRKRHEPGFRALAAQGAEDPRLHRRDPVAGLRADDLERIAEETGGSYAAATSPVRADTDLRRARLRARQRVPRSLQLCRATRTEVECHRGRGHEPVSFSYDRPAPGTAAPYQPAFRDELLQSWVLIPLIVGLGPRSHRVRAALVLESPLEQGARRTARRVRHPPGGGDRGTSQGGRPSPCAMGEQRSAAQLPLVRGLRGGRRRGQINRDPTG